MQGTIFPKEESIFPMKGIKFLNREIESTGGYSI